MSSRRVTGNPVEVRPAFVSAASAHPDGYRAVSEALDRMAAALPYPDVVLLAVSASYPREGVARALRERSGDRPLIGASAMSVVGDPGWIERGVSAAGTRHGCGRVTVGLVEGVRRADAHKSVERLSRAIPDTGGDTLVVFFGDILVPDYNALCRAVGERRPDLTLCGACSVFDTALGPDDEGFLANWQVFGDTVREDSIVFAAFEGAARPGRAAHGFAHGFQHVGRPAVVTRAEGNIIHEIDGRPAREHFRKYIGDEELRIDGYGNLVCFSVSRQAIGVSTPQYSLPLEFIEGGAVRVLNTVLTGSEIVLCMTTRQDLIEAARGCAAAVRRGFGDADPAGLLVFSCAGRQTALGRRCEEEIAAVRETVGWGVPTFGFYSGGEFAPDPDPASGGRTIYNAYTITLLAFGASATAGGTGRS